MRTDLTEYTSSMIFIGSVIIGSCITTLSCFGMAALVAYRCAKNRQLRQQPAVHAHRGSISDMTLTMSQRSVGNLRFPNLDESNQSTLSAIAQAFHSNEDKTLPGQLKKDHFETKYENEHPPQRLSPVREDSLEKSSSTNPDSRLNEDKSNKVLMHVPAQMLTNSDSPLALAPPAPRLSFLNTLPPSRQGASPSSMASAATPGSESSRFSP